MTTEAEPSPRASAPHLLLLVIALIGFVFRVGYMSTQYDHESIGGDAAYYHHQANFLADGRWFIQPLLAVPELREQMGEMVPEGDLGGDHASADHPPLFSAFLAIGSVMGFRSIYAHQVMTCMLGALGVWLAGLAGLALGSRPTCIWAAVLVAVWPNLWINDGLVLSESLVVPMVALFVLALVKMVQRKSLRTGLIAGLVGAACALTRAELVLCLPLVACWLTLKTSLGARDSGRDIKALVLCGVGLVGGAVLLIGPWFAYNLTRFDHPVLISTAPGIGLADSNCDEVYYGDLLGFWYIGPECLVDLDLSKDPSSEDLRLRKVAFDYMSSHRSRIPVVVGARLGRLWQLYEPLTSIGASALDGRTTGGSSWVLASSFLLYPLAIGGVVIGVRRKLEVFAALIPAVVVSTTMLFTAGLVRYRVSADVGLVLLAALCLSCIPAPGRSGRGADVDHADGVGVPRPHRLR